MDIHEVRKTIFNRDGNKCYKCKSTRNLVMDHVNPKSIFHYHGIDNILTLCWKCNKSKFNHILPESELDKIKKYLENVNKDFTIEEIEEMGRIIEEHFTQTKKVKKQKITRTNWKDLAIPDKNGDLNKWSIYRMRN